MHPYASDDAGRQHVPLMLLCLSVVGALLTSFLLEHLWTPPWWVEIPSVIGWYGGLSTVFDRRWWRWRIWRSLGLVSTPCLAGCWSATLTSSHDGHEEEHLAEVEITQTWQRISIRLATGRSRSVSTAASITKDGPDVTLNYQYKNTPNADSVLTMHAHRGAADLYLVPDATRMTGQYYSGRDRHTVGQMTLTREVAPARQALVCPAVGIGGNEGHRAG